MANRARACGLSQEVQQKIAKQYHADLEQILILWITAQCGKDVGRPQPRHENIQNRLRDGVLCERINGRYVPRGAGPVKKIQASSVAFKWMEQMSQFLSAAKRYGIYSTDIFQTRDLWEGKMACVQRTLMKLGGLAVAWVMGFSLGIPAGFLRNPRKALRTYRTTSCKRMGTNHRASQAGMTGYGMSCQFL
uniref:Calponin-homology (CH) domain-containing protein n=1 Tax=Myotis lucifugus TaxID=59463 RepID=G1Q4N4_MYOLU